MCITVDETPPPPKNEKKVKKNDTEGKKGWKRVWNWFTDRLLHVGITNRCVFTVIISVKNQFLIYYLFLR